MESVNPDFRLKVMYCIDCIWYDIDESRLMVQVSKEDDPVSLDIPTKFLGIGCNCDDCNEEADVDDDEPEKCANLRADNTYSFEITKNYAKLNGVYINEVLSECLSSKPCDPCECNADNTGCENTLCTGCAKCEDNGICIDGKWKDEIPEIGIFTCCGDGDCDNTVCVEWGPVLRSAYCEYGSRCSRNGFCDGSVDLYCGDDKSQCESHCNPLGCTINTCDTGACNEGENCCVNPSNCVSCKIEHYGSFQGACVNGRWYWFPGDSEVHKTPYIPCCEDDDCPDYYCWSPTGNDNTWACEVSVFKNCRTPASDPGRGGSVEDQGLNCLMERKEDMLSNYDTCMERCEEIYESLIPGNGGNGGDGTTTTTITNGEQCSDVGGTCTSVLQCINIIGGDCYSDDFECDWCCCVV